MHTPVVFPWRPRTARPRYRLRWWRLMWIPIALILSIGRVAHAASPSPMIIGSDVDPNSYANKWAKLFFEEAFKRLNTPMQINHYPLARRNALVDAGTVDIDGGRVFAYGQANPSLIRVDEPFVEYKFALFTAHPTLQLANLPALQSSTWLVEYRRGILFCERSLKPLLPEVRLSDISSEEQGVNKLLAGRTDLYCDLDYVVRQVLALPQFKEATRVRKVLSLGTLPIYLYLQPRHADLAPRLSAVIKAIKAEGLIEAYQAKVAREMGLPEPL